MTRRSPAKHAPSRRSAGKRASAKTSARRTTRAARQPAKTTKRAAKTKTTKRPAKAANSRRPATRRWSHRVTKESDALDLKQGVFTLKDPKRIAASLKRSAEHSTRRKSGAFRSALSMLTFYINRAGHNLPQAQRARLERAKDELRRQFGR